MAQPPAAERIAVGKITKSHGVLGEVVVLVLSEDPGRFAAGASVQTESGRTLTVHAARSHHGRELVAFEGIGDRSAADMLRGSYLFVERDQLGALPDDAWWPHDLEGCSVRTESGLELGTLREVVHTEANDVWIVRGDDAGDGDPETLIPALRDIVVQVDIPSKRILVRDVEGLTRPEG